MAKAKKETNKYVVIEPYFDAQFNKEMAMGDELDLEAARAKELIDLKLIKSLERA